MMMKAKKKTNKKPVPNLLPIRNPKMAKLNPMIM
jgi:hypothetical protein